MAAAVVRTARVPARDRFDRSRQNPWIPAFATMNEIYRSYFAEGRYPARTTVGVTLPHPDFLLEIECVAEV